MTRMIASVVVAGLVLTLAPVSAHHSFTAMYDANKSVKVTGKVTKMAWGNPHVYFYVDVLGANGGVANWAVEGPTPNNLQRNGWKRDSLKVGDTVTVEGYLARDGTNHINGRNVTLPDGRRVFTGSADGGPGAPD
jgi:Family of unknown function (DUF6152)